MSNHDKDHAEPSPGADSENEKRPEALGTVPPDVAKPAEPGPRSSLAEAVASALARASNSPPPARSQTKPTLAMPVVTPAEVEGEATQDSAEPTQTTESKNDPAAATSHSHTDNGSARSDVTEPVLNLPNTEPNSEEMTLQFQRMQGVLPASISVQYYGRTDVGQVREHNEDNFLIGNLSTGDKAWPQSPTTVTIGKRGCVFAVCDGMGGAAAGEVASQFAVDTVFERLLAARQPADRDEFARQLVGVVEEAGARIFGAAKADRKMHGMGTTATVAGLIDDVLFVGQVGDSRAYVLRGDRFALITKDQSLVNQLIEAGQLTEDEAENFEYSNIILQALGTTEDINVDLTFLELRKGDRLLLCSDGLSGLVHADMMKEVLLTTPDLSEAAGKLIAAANQGGGPDNITVVLAEFGGDLKAIDEARVAYQQYPLPPLGDTAQVISSSSNPPPRNSQPSQHPSKQLGRGLQPPSRETAGNRGARLWSIAVVVVLLIGVVALWWALREPEATIHSLPAHSGTQPSTQPGRLVVHVSGSGEFWVDGTRREATQGTLRETSGEFALPPGSHRVEFRRGLEVIGERTVNIVSGRELHVDLRDLVEPDLAEGAAEPTSGEAPDLVPNAPPRGVEPPVEPTPRANRPARPRTPAPIKGVATFE